MRLNYSCQRVVGSLFFSKASIQMDDQNQAWTFLSLTCCDFFMEFITVYTEGEGDGPCTVGLKQVVVMSPVCSKPGSSPGLPMHRELVTTRGAAQCHAGVAVGLTAALTHSPGITPELISPGSVSLGTALR